VMGGVSAVVYAVGRTAEGHRQVGERIVCRRWLCPSVDAVQLGASTVRVILDPLMIHELFPSPTETAFGRHPCRVVSVTYRKLWPFHGGNTDSNPVGHANNLEDLLKDPFFRGDTQGRFLLILSP
jgi:hypothetical protein